MFDLTSRITYKNVPKWHRDINRIVQSIPVVLVGNKCDDENCKISGDEVEYAKDKNIPYYEISCITNYQFELPFLIIMRQLVGDPNLKLVQAPPRNEIEAVNCSDNDVCLYNLDVDRRRGVEHASTRN